MRLFCLLSMLVFLSGCGPSLTQYRPRLAHVDEPAQDQPITVSVGEEMLRKGDYLAHHAVRLRQTVKLGPLNGYTLSPGVYLRQRTGTRSDYYRPAAGARGGRLDKSFFSDGVRAIEVYRDQNTVCVVVTLGNRVCRDDVALTHFLQSRAQDNSFIRTLIYSGRVGDKINVGYREYEDLQARPSFANEVEYDVAASALIGYKGAQIEVLHADNQSITYVVRRSFPDF